MVIRKQTFIFLHLLISFSNAEVLSREEINDFNEFKRIFNKAYETSIEHERRQNIFLQNAKFIKDHNEKYNKKLTTYSLAINEFADMEAEEFRRYTDDAVDYDDISNDAVKDWLPNFDIIPESIDWRTLGAVTPVKKQRKCGSCWAFSATGALEGQHFRKTGNLVSLSEQNLIDCTIFLGNKGCNGGLKERAFQYVIDNGGIATEESYPYKAELNSECLFENSTIGTTSFGYVDIPRNDETILTIAVAINGPISVSVNATCLKLQFYSEGLIDYDDCEPRPVNHGMLIVGYGRNNETLEDYWILKNSWGPQWGIDGYTYIPRFRNFAGVASRPSFPLV